MKNLNIFTTVRPILTKFGMLMRLDPLHPIANKFRDFKNPKWRRRPRLKLKKLECFQNKTTNFDDI